MSDTWYVSAQQPPGYGVPTSEQKRAFRDALQRQIFVLTGYEPRFEEQLQEGTGKMQWIIFRE